MLNADGIVLTSYFDERSRVNGTPTRDGLIELYRTGSLASSIMLRGLSDDLPLAVTAIDSQPNIEAILEKALELNHLGLTTIGAAQFLRDEISPVDILERADAATKLTIYLGSQDQVYGVPAFEVICEVLQRHGIHGATVMPGVDGTTRGRRRRARFASRDTDAPLMVIAVGNGHQIGTMLPELGDLLRHPLITLERVRLCKRQGQLISQPEQPHGVDDHGSPLGCKLTIYTSVAARRDGEPIHRAIVRGMRSTEICCAITHRGTWGFRGDRLPHGDKFLLFTRHMPAVTTVIATGDHVSDAFDVVDELTSERGLVTSETIPVIRTSGPPPA
ncbi:MAG TPA: DUF190 domain-containing protein [Streptosporangiaceae bacterium]